MKIRIENVGPVKTIDLDLSKPFIIFTGLNGCGKTYISYVIYSFYASFVNNDDILGWKQVVEKNKNKRAFIRCDKIYNILYEHVEVLNEMLPYIFNVNEDDSLIKNARISLLTTRDEINAIIKEREYSFTAEDVFSFYKKSGTLSYSLKNLGGGIADTQLVNYIVLKVLLFGNIIEDIETSERGGLYTFNKELWLGKTMINGDPVKEYPEHNLLSYPLPIKEALNSLGDLTKKFYEKSRYGFLADMIEEKILKGHLALRNKDEVWYKSQSMKKEIPLSLTSSGVKTICSIILFLRHTAMDCSLIIVDEPELNLHPCYQVLVAKAFSLIINSGIRLIINTHSDYIIREINNMIMLSSVPDNKIEKLGYNQNNVLYEQDVCPYYFELQKDNKSVVGREVEVTKTGFSIKLIDDVISSQISTSQKIYELLEDK